jgi:hypothetical protein
MSKKNNDCKVKQLEKLLQSTCDSINNVNELSERFNIDDNLFRNLLDTNKSTGKTFIKEGFLQIYNDALAKNK